MGFATFDTEVDTAVATMVVARVVEARGRAAEEVHSVVVDLESVAARVDYLAEVVDALAAVVVADRMDPQAP